MSEMQQNHTEVDVRALQRDTTAVIAAYLAMFVLDATIVAGALPNVYVNDPSANCGARFLVHYAVTALWWSGGIMLILVANLGLFRVIVRLKPTYSKLGLPGHTLLVGLAAIIFFLMAASQLKTLQNPPKLPTALTNCESMGRQRP